MAAEAVPGARLGEAGSRHSSGPLCHQGPAVPQPRPARAPWRCGAPWDPAWSSVTPTAIAPGPPSAAPPAAATSANRPPTVKPPAPCGAETPHVPSLTCPRLSPPGQGRHPLGCTHPPSGLPLATTLRVVNGSTDTRLLSPWGRSWARGSPPAGKAAPPPRRGALPTRGETLTPLSLGVPARPGLCPPVADGDQAAECLLLCLQDKECPPGQKCCLRGCGRACVPPLRGKAPPQPATSWVPAARGHRAGLTAAAAGPAWRGLRGAQGGGTPVAPIPQGGSTHPALAPSSVSSRHSLALAGKGCTRSCCFGAAPQPAAIAPLWVSKEVLLPAAPATPAPVPAPDPPHRWQDGTGIDLMGPGQGPRRPQPLPAMPPRAAHPPHHPTPGQG